MCTDTNIILNGDVTTLIIIHAGVIFHQTSLIKKGITSKGAIVEGAGMHLSIPEGSISAEESLTIHIHPCLSGPFELNDYESASPAYLIKPSKKVEFHKEVIMKINHYVCLESKDDCEDMMFLSAKSTPELKGSTPVYLFKEIKGYSNLEVKWERLL